MCTAVKCGVCNTIIRDIYNLYIHYDRFHQDTPYPKFKKEDYVQVSQLQSKFYTYIILLTI